MDRRLAAFAIVLASAAVALPVAAAAPSLTALAARLAVAERRIQKQEDIEDIGRLTRAYGYYVDKQLWDQVTDLFSTDAVVEIAGRGVYRNRAGVDTLFRKVMGGGQIGLRSGALFNHMILQGITDVAPEGKTAMGRWRAFVQIARYGKAAIWSEGTYENSYVKQGGVWKIAAMHFYATYYTPYEKGWRDGALPNNGPSTDFPPDGPQSIDYDVFPGHYVPPFHYPNPVTGKPWTEEDTRRYSTSGETPPPARPSTDPERPAPPR